MPITIAVLADLHLPHLSDTAQWAAAEWALDDLSVRQADLIVVAGDVTACGPVNAARRLRARLDATGRPYLVTPGNSDRRSPERWPAIAEALHTDRAFASGGCLVLVADTSEAGLAPAERAALEQAVIPARTSPAVVLVTHMAPETLDHGSRGWLERWLSQRGVGLIIAGHQHRDIAGEFGPAEVHVVRGLDPDKAIGGPPCVTLLRDGGETWHRDDVAFPGGALEPWSAAERLEFTGLLGLSCPGDALGGLAGAASLGAPCIELRETAAATPRGVLQRHLADWREAGGKHLSWHLPTLSWDTETARVGGREPWLESLAAALDVGASALTVHVPKAPVGAMEPGSEAWEQLAGVTANDLAPAVARGCTVGIENMHMGRSEAPDASRRFGYLPDECLRWVREVRGRLRPESVGMLLDIGHARNNAPYADRFTLGTWYAAVGPECVGYHLHQVRLAAGGMANHQPLTGLHDPLISLSSFLWAWRAGQLRHAPMFLEVRAPDGGPQSLQALRALLAR